MAEQDPVDVAPVAEAEPIYYFKLGSCDDKEVKISSEAIKQSKTLNDLISNLQYNAEEGESTEVIPMDNIKEPTLIKVFKRTFHESLKIDVVPKPTVL